MPVGWRIATASKIARHTRFDLVADGATTVLRLSSHASYANLVHRVAANREPEAVAPTLAWRWRVDQAVAGADLTRKEGDDVPARVCVLFDVPAERLSFAARWAVSIGRRLFDPDLPAAALCYVWDSHLAAGTWLPNAYTDRVRMLILRSADTGQWVNELRNLRADFARAFPREARPPHAGAPTYLPPIVAVAVSADSDNTGASSLAFIGDLALTLQ